MKKKHKVLALALAFSLSTPTFAMVHIEDTFTQINIDKTFVGGDNKYILGSDNTIRAKGTSVFGVNSTKTDTGEKWMQIVANSNGTTLNNIVKMVSKHNYVYAIDKDGDAYYIAGIPKKITVTGEENIKFTDVGEAFDTYTSRRFCYLVADNGNVYKGNGATFTKLDDVTDAESICMAYIGDVPTIKKHSIIVILTKNKELYYGDYNAKSGKLEAITDVVNVYGGVNEFFLKFESGRIGRAAEGKNAVTMLDIPEDENFIDMFGSDNGIVGLITDKNVYIIKDEGLSKCAVSWDAELSANSHRRITSLNNDLAIDNYGCYYTWNYLNDSLILTKLGGIEKWANENPVVFQSELANFDIPLNEIYKRNKSYDFTFNLVTQEQPTAFNIYYSKTEDRNTKEKWVKIGDAVSVAILNKQLYDTGYVDSIGNKITGYSYTYNWKVGTEDLVGIHLIVEPIY